jgi:hypothetical protein
MGKSHAQAGGTKEIQSKSLKYIILKNFDKYEIIYTFRPAKTDRVGSIA